MRTVQCPLEGFEAVAVTYNLMASEAEMTALQETLGAAVPNALIVEVHGWPAQFGLDPFGPQAPLIWRAWAVRVGFTQALVEFATDPNSWTGSRGSTRLMPTAG
jgi:hypothetical protein